MTERLRLLRLRIDRWRHERCDLCGLRFGWKDSPHTYGGSEKWHRYCLAYRDWRRVADERLQILDTVTDLWSIDAATVQTAYSLRGDNPGETSTRWDLAWRVFRSLDQHRRPKETTTP